MLDQNDARKQWITIHSASGLRQYGALPRAPSATARTSPYLAAMTGQAASDRATDSKLPRPIPKLPRNSRYRFGSPGL
jgi:hypothetical protein